MRRTRARMHEDMGPRLLLSPMIDLIFLLLVAFIAGAMTMTDIHTVPVRLPVVTHASETGAGHFIVTMKKDGTLYLNDRQVTEEALVEAAEAAASHDASFSIVIRSDKEASYGQVMKLLDDLKGAGITRFSLASDVVKP
jgi:biopolymer transport protein ExbD